MTAQAAWFPPHPVEAGHVAPVPRRIRAVKDGAVIADTRQALYVWEHERYPQYALPRGAFDDAVLAALEHTVIDGGGLAAGHVRVAWDAVDSWFEEEEEVFVHPRSPYVRVDALRAARPIRVERDGLLLAEAPSFVAVFETGLPTRHYVERTALKLQHLVASDTETACPYKGRTTDYWSLRLPGGHTVPDIAWSYAFPTPALAPIAGLVAFYDERVETTIGER